MSIQVPITPPPITPSNHQLECWWNVPSEVKSVTFFFSLMGVDPLRCGVKRGTLLYSFLNLYDAMSTARLYDHNKKLTNEFVSSTEHGRLLLWRLSTSGSKFTHQKISTLSSNYTRIHDPRKLYSLEDGRFLEFTYVSEMVVLWERVLPTLPAAPTSMTHPKWECKTLFQIPGMVLINNFTVLGDMIVGIGSSNNFYNLVGGECGWDKYHATHSFFVYLINQNNVIDGLDCCHIE